MPATDERSPLIWVLLGHRAGDNAQARDVAHSVGGNIVTKQLSYNLFHHAPNILLGASLASVDRARSDALEAPWPDLVVAVGKRAAPVSLWIKRASGGTCRNVHIGRPRAPLGQFDLVLTTPQYGLPHAANVLELAMPFKSVSAADNEQADLWIASWKGLPRPWLMAAIGGEKFPLRLGEAELHHYGEMLNTAAQASGGSILLFDSPRSRPGAIDAVASHIRVPLWRSMGEGGSYVAGLASADAFAVTSDSLSMLGDMISTRREVSVFKLPLRLAWLRRLGGARFLKRLSRHGVMTPPRDVQGYVDALVRRGIVRELGKDVHAPRGAFDPQSDAQKAVVRIKALLADRA